MYSDLELLVNKEITSLGLDYKNPSDVDYFWRNKL